MDLFLMFFLFIAVSAVVVAIVKLSIRFQVPPAAASVPIVMIALLAGLALPWQLFIIVAMSIMLTSAVIVFVTDSADHSE